MAGEEESNNSLLDDADNNLTTPQSDENGPLAPPNHNEFRVPVQRPKNSLVDMGTQYETPRDDWMSPDEFYETQITDINSVRKKKKKGNGVPTYEVYVQTENIPFEAISGEAKSQPQIVPKKVFKEIQSLPDPEPENRIEEDKPEIQEFQGLPEVEPAKNIEDNRLITAEVPMESPVVPNDPIELVVNNNVPNKTLAEEPEGAPVLVDEIDDKDYLMSFQRERSSPNWKTRKDSQDSSIGNLDLAKEFDEPFKNDSEKITTKVHEEYKNDWDDIPMNVQEDTNKNESVDEIVNDNNNTHDIQEITTNINVAKAKMKTVGKFRRKITTVNHYSEPLQSVSNDIILADSKPEPSVVAASYEDLSTIKAKKRTKSDAKRKPRKSKSQDRELESKDHGNVINNTSLQKNLFRIIPRTDNSVPVVTKSNDRRPQQNKAPRTNYVSPFRGKSKETINSTSNSSGYSTTSTNSTTINSTSTITSSNFQKPTYSYKNKALSHSFDPIDTSQNKKPHKTLHKRNSLPPLMRTTTTTPWATNKLLPYQVPKPRYTNANRPPWQGWSSKATYFVDPKYYL